EALLFIRCRISKQAAVEMWAQIGSATCLHHQIKSTADALIKTFFIVLLKVGDPLLGLFGQGILFAPLFVDAFCPLDHPSSGIRMSVAVFCKFLQVAGML